MPELEIRARTLDFIYNSPMAGYWILNTQVEESLYIVFVTTELIQVFNPTLETISQRFTWDNVLLNLGDGPEKGALLCSICVYLDEN